MDSTGSQCHVVAFEGRASFPLWARPGQPTAPRNRRDSQGRPILERGICSFSQVLNFWYDAVLEAVQRAERAGGAVPCSWSYYAQNHWRWALRDILQRYSQFRQGLGEQDSPGQAIASGSAQGAAGQPAQGKSGENTEHGPTPANLPTPQTDQDIHGFLLVLLGFSNGGDAVYQTAKALERHGIRVDLAITVDPVRKPLRGMGFMGFRRPSNVARWINYYQRFDRRTLAGLLPIVGRHVEGADENIRLFSEDFPDPKTRPKAHLWIPSLAPVRRKITEELEVLLSGRGLG